MVDSVQSDQTKSKSIRFSKFCPEDSNLENPTRLLNSLREIDLNLRRNCRWRCSNAGDSLGRYLIQEKVKLSNKAGSGSSKVISFLFPFTFLCQQRWFQFTLLVLGGYQFYKGSSAILIFERYGVQRFQSYRLFAAENSSESSQILGFDLLRQGCKVDQQAVQESRILSDEVPARAQFTLSFSSGAVQEIDGFSLTINSTLPANQAGISFVIEGSDNRSGIWVTVGSSRFRRVRSGIRFLRGEIYPGPGLANLVLDHRAPWPLIFEECWVQLMSGLFLICVSIGGAVGKIERCWTMVIEFLFVLGLSLLIVVVGYISLGLAREAFLPACMTASSWCFLALISHSQRHLRRGLIAQGLSVLVCQAVNECSLFEDCGYLSESIEIVTLVTIFGSAISVLVSRQVVSRAIRDVHADREEYDRAWHPVVSRPSHRRMLKELQNATARLARACPSHGARQLDRRHGAWSASGAGSGRFLSLSGSQPALVRAAAEGLQASIAAVTSLFGRHGVIVEQFQRGVPGTCDEFRPIRCPGRLYSQALIVAECLQARAAKWACEAGARLQPSLDLTLFENTTECENGANSRNPNKLELDKWIQTGLLKCPKRTVEKALVCYEGDLSRVVDVCRVRVVATGLQQVLSVVNRIAEDGCVRILRIKNTMRSHHSLSPTAGFRGVVMNVCFCGEVANLMGIENHVCEVQVVLDTFADLLQEPDRHKRYLMFRAVRILSNHFSLAGLGLPSAFRHGLFAWGNRVSHLNSAVTGMSEVESPGPRLSSSLNRRFSAESDASTETGGPATSLRSRQEEVSPTARPEYESKKLISAWNDGAVDEACISNGPFPFFESDPTENNEITGGSFRSRLMSTVSERVQDLGKSIDESIPTYLLNIVTNPVEMEGKPCATDDWSKVSERPMFEVFERSTLQDGGLLSGLTFHDSLLSSSSVLFTRQESARDLHLAPTDDVLFSNIFDIGISRPVTVAATKPIFQICALLISVNFAYWGSVSASQLASSGIYNPWPQVVRFSIRGLRDPNLPVTSVNPTTFGLLKDGCPLYPNANNSNGTATIRFEKPIVANGYFLQVPSGAVSADPVRWKIEAVGGEPKPMDIWNIVGASAWQGQGDTTDFYPSLPFDFPTERNLRLDFDNRPKWPWFLSDVMTTFCTSFGWFAFSLSRLSSMNRAGVLVLCFMFLANGLLQASGAVGFSLSGDWRQSVEGWINAAPDVVFAASIWWDERHIVRTLLIYGFLKILTPVLQATVLYNDKGGFSFSLLSNGGVWALTLTFANLFFHRRALHRARRLVLADKAKYDAVWKEVQASVERQKIEALQNWIVYLGRFFKLSGQGRQLNRIRSVKPENHRLSLTLSGLSGISASIATSRRSSSVDGTRETIIAPPMKQGWENLLDCGLPTVADPSRPVNSLDQLYFQATALNPILIVKVQGWASASGGCFIASSNDKLQNVASPSIFGSLKSIRSTESKKGVNPADLDSHPVGTLPHGYVRWIDVKESEREQGGKIKWCKIKSVQRSIEKSTRSYGKDVSRLLDICRQSIYFESITGVYECLVAISRDPDVVIVRMKNRFDPELDSAASAGYRNLAINLKVVTEETQSLGIELHVCEVQLLLLKMAIIKNEDGHKKYITFRNLRGE